MNDINLFERFKPQFVNPIKHLLYKYNVDYEHDIKINDIGYSIRNGILNIKPNILSLGHELAHIVLINNFDKLLIDNWGMPLINEGFSSKTLRKFLLHECKVWGTENYLYIIRRQPTDYFLKTALGYEKNKAYSKLFDSEKNIDEKFNEEKEKVLNLMHKHERKMYFDKFINELEIRLAFVKNHIDNNPEFNSIKFDLLFDKKVKL